VLFHGGDGALTLDLGSDQLDAHKAKTRQERAAEAARLLYVAITRAEFLCYITWGCISDAHASPLFKLLHATTVTDSKTFKSYPDQSILADIAQLGSRADGLAAAFMPVDAPAPPYRPAGENLPEPVCRSLSQAISSGWRVTSFSGMVAGSERNLQPRDYDALSSMPPEALPDGAPDHPDGRTIFDFPRGAAAGTCLHEIFERLDFAALTGSHITQSSRACLLANGYQEHWLPAVTGMVTAVTRSALLADRPAFNLSQLPKSSWQSEMEFYLPIAQLSPDKLRILFDGLLDPAIHGRFNDLLDSLDFRQSRGMLHGFMDMVFMHEGRYYIIDWKSNHLGFTCQQYSQADMTRSMADHSYILQYHLYSLALDRYLKLRLPGYSYESHFGGAIYIYLRGISSETTGFGIYRDRPAAEFIRRADELMLA
ncbi:MAG: hypothetical protein H7X83_08155, partial [Verrucomicrobia bacterium]|nr:hypothetical protein [Deltaproteobacteria bacterium]